MGLTNLISFPSVDGYSSISFEHFQFPIPLFSSLKIFNQAQISVYHSDSSHANMHF